MIRPAIVALLGITLLIACARDRRALDDAKPHALVFQELRLPSTAKEKREAQSILELFEPHLEKGEIVTSFHFGSRGVSCVGFMQTEFVRGGTATFEHKNSRWTLVVKLYQGLPPRAKNA